MKSVQDHCVHGLVTVRLLDAPARVLKGIVESLGESQGNPADPPDVSVVFTDRIPTDTPLRFLGLNQAAFDSRNFYLFNDDGARSKIDFDRLGEPCEVVCERGVGTIPFLLPILGLRLLKKGYALFHSSAFVYEGKAILVAGWQKGGKSELLLPFMAAGAHFLSDDWTIVGADSTLFGIASSVPMGPWHLQHLPEYWQRIEPGHRRRIRMVRLYQHLYRMLPAAVRSRLRPRRFLRPLGTTGGEMGLLRLSSAPRRVFGDHIWRDPAKLDLLLFGTVVQDGIRTLELGSNEVAERMVWSLAFERRHLMEAYDQFRFAFPHRRNLLLESARDCELALLSTAFEGVPSYEIQHPYPVPLQRLRAAALPLIPR
jgi:hypothetical protein